MSDNQNPQDPFEEARRKAMMAQYLLEEFFKGYPIAEDTEEAKEKRNAACLQAMQFMVEIEQMGFPVEWTNTSHRPYDDHLHPIISVAVMVLRPPGPDASPAARARYSAWYKIVMDIPDDPPFPVFDADDLN
ncbi:MAG: hypothetical protein Q8L24_02270 [bacterium]|nr:hypothetical protein [bacterium]